MKAYGQSKLANVLFARSLAKRLQGELRSMDMFSSPRLLASVLVIIQLSFLPPKKHGNYLSIRLTGSLPFGSLSPLLFLFLCLMAKN